MVVNTTIELVVMDSFTAMIGKLVDWDSNTGAILQQCLLQSTNHINFCIGDWHLLQRDDYCLVIIPFSP